MIARLFTVLPPLSPLSWLTMGPSLGTTAEALLHVRKLEASRQERLLRAHAHAQQSLVAGKTIVCISDTHGKEPAQIPDGDVFIHAGDLTSGCSQWKLQAQLDWINRLPHRHKVVIAGNHDTWLDPKCNSTSRASSTSSDSAAEERCAPAALLHWGAIHYLCDTAVTLAFPDHSTLKVYGSPQTARFGTCGFQYAPYRDVWSNVVPADTDILVVHGPAKFHRDGTGNYGDANLLAELWRVRPKLFVHGHIHEASGRDILTYDAFQRAFEDALSGKKGLALLATLLKAMTTAPVASEFPRLLSDHTVVINAALRPNEEANADSGPYVEVL